MLEIKSGEVKVDLTNPPPLRPAVPTREDRGADRVGFRKPEIKVDHRARPLGAIDFRGAAGEVAPII
jgi:hypothetical protein